MDELTTRTAEGVGPHGGTAERTPELIGAEIRMYVDAGRRVTLLCGIEIGRRLVEAKELLKHGEWLPWLERETAFSDRQAQRYMKVFNEYGAAQLGLFGPETNATTLSDLSFSKALALLSVPESEREEFAAEVDAEAISVKELEKAIAEKKAAEERALEAERALHELEEGEGLAIAELQEKLEQAEKTARDAKAEAARAAEGVGPYRERAEAAENTVTELRAQIRELETRPQPVAVERDEKAIEDAVRQAKAEAAVEWSEKTKKLTDKLNEATAKAEKLKAKADKASAGADEKIAAAEKETERIRQELEAARRQLKLSDADVTAFGIHFNGFQQELNQTLAALRKLAEKDAATAGKLLVPVRQVLEKAADELSGLEERAAQPRKEEP